MKGHIASESGLAPKCDRASAHYECCHLINQDRTDLLIVQRRAVKVKIQIILVEFLVL